MLNRRRVFWIVAALLLLGGGLLAYQKLKPKRNRPIPLIPRSERRYPKAEASPPTPPPPTGQPVRLTQATAAPAPAADHGLIEGTVRSSADSVGVEGAELTFSLGGAAFTTRTGQGGRFTFKPPTTDTYQLQSASAPGFFPYAPEWGHSPIRLTAQPGTKLDHVDLYLSPAVTYSGQVVAPSGTPLAGAEVRVIDTPGEEATLLSPSDVRTTDRQGAFALQAPAFSLLEARHPDYLPGRALLDLPAQASRTVTLRLLEKPADAQPSAPASLSGRVTDKTGTPVEGALITASPEGNVQQGLHPTRRATSNGDGRFQVTGLDPGTYTLTATSPPYVPAHKDSVRTGSQDVELLLEDGARLFGTVRDARTDLPVPSFTLQVSGRDGLTRRPLVTRAFMDPSGHYDLRVPAGELAMVVAAYGYAPSEEVALLASVAGPVRTDVRLSHGGRIFGKVLDEQSRVPLSGAQIAIEGRMGPAASALPVLVSTATNAEGDFSLDGVAPGLRSVTVSAPGHHTRILSGLEIREDGSVGPLSVDLRATGKDESPRIELVGIGAVLKPQQDVLKVMQTLPQGGAVEAGMAVGDAVLRIDGQDVGTLGFEGAINRIRGVEGSVVRVTLRRAVDGQVVEMAVVRRRVRS